jgi:hypothetical protein
VFTLNLNPATAGSCWTVVTRCNVMGLKSVYFHMHPKEDFD